jgi:hypothetical protein
VVVVNKIFKMPIVKSLNTDCIVLLISVLCADGSINVGIIIFLPIYIIYK